MTHQDSFVHLHVHTEYSILDGAARLKDLFAETSKANMPAVAMTDHGNLYGAFDFHSKASDAGVKPIIGIEAYVAPASRFHKQPVKWGNPSQKSDDVSGNGAYTHKTLLAASPEGLRNLFRLSSLASLEGYMRHPRMDRELLAQYSKGIIATTGCPSSEVQTRLRLGQEEEAFKAAAEYRDIFGAENYFVEIMDHGLEIERRVRDGLRDIAARLKLPFVVTNDLHYTHEHDAEAHEVLLCVQTGSNLADPNRFKFGGNGYFVKTPQQMRSQFSDEEWQEGCDSTLLIAERVQSYDEVFAHRDLMPRFPVPEGETEETWLAKEVQRGLGRRFPGGIPEQHQKQADYEVSVILHMGFPGYFLVTADLIRHSQEVGIRVGPGRGSAAGSVIAWALGITELDPMAHGLLFERFLNPDRVTMPDIDIDFDERRRGDMIRYATERYGDDRVAQIITYGTIKAKAAVKDAARVLGFPYALGDRITKAMPPAVMGKDIPLGGIFDSQHPRYAEASEFRELYEQEADVKRVVDTARGLEGLVRQSGVHAAGVILSSEPLVDVIPVHKREQDGAIITQFDMGACESMGLLKMDFLGLRNLTVLDDCLESIEANRGEKLVLEELSLDDRAAYELLARGDTLGVFQLDGGPMRSLLRAMKPDNFEDISAVLALYRPGPMGANAHIEYADRKNGRKPVVPIHPELAEPLQEILGDTYGLIVYQEQVMAIAQQLAGYSLGKADLLRRAMGKKKKEILEKEYVPFADGMKANGYSDDAIKTLWDILVPFSDYAFNKSHTAGYGLVSYWTAYLKANYPAEYMAGLLTSVRDDKDKIAIYLAECRRMGVKVLPPDVNESEATFTAIGTDIRFGLAGVRNVGGNVVEAITRARRERGRFSDFHDFLSKVDATVCNKRTVESLIKAGAFDSLGHNRRGLVEIHADAIDAVLGTKRAEAVGQYDLFGGFGNDAVSDDVSTMMRQPIPTEEWDKKQLLAFEREMLGLYVSDHPLMGMEQALAAHADTPIARLTEGDMADGTVVTVGGILAGVTRKVTKQGKAWAMASLQDLDGSVEALFFPATYENVGEYLAEDSILIVRARVDKREDAPRLIALDVSIPNLDAPPQPRKPRSAPPEAARSSSRQASSSPAPPSASQPSARPVLLTISADRCDDALARRLGEILAQYSGSSEVRIRLVEEPATTLRLPQTVESSNAFMADVKALLGPGSVD